MYLKLKNSLRFDQKSIFDNFLPPFFRQKKMYLAEMEKQKSRN